MLAPLIWNKWFSGTKMLGSTFVTLSLLGLRLFLCNLAHTRLSLRCSWVQLSCWSLSIHLVCVTFFHILFILRSLLCYTALSNRSSSSWSSPPAILLTSSTLIRAFISTSSSFAILIYSTTFIIWNWLLHFYLVFISADFYVRAFSSTSLHKLRTNILLDQNYSIDRYSCLFWSLSYLHSLTCTTRSLYPSPLISQNSF